MDEAQTLLRLIKGKSTVRVELGYFRGLDLPRVIVDVGGGRIPADTASAYLPEVNEQVQVLFIDGKPWMLGPAVPKPGEGVVVTVSAGLATVQTDVGQVIAPFPLGAALTSGDQVKLYWSQGPFIIARMSTAPAAPPAPAPAAPAGGNRQQVFTAIQAGAWQTAGGRWSSDQPRASNGYLGAWHYGTKIADTIPAAAQMPASTATPAVEVFIRFASKFGNPPNFALHAQAARAGAPVLTSSFPWDVVDGWNRLPSAQEALFFNSLKAGGGALGIGLNHGGVNRFASLGEDPQSGALRITWRT